MNDYYLRHMDLLNHPEPATRLRCLQALADGVKTGQISRPASTGRDVNNHIHTTFSFSPYSPSKAVWLAYVSGLTTAGIMDHDSVAGAGEFILAGMIVGLATTVGLEVRVDVAGTPLEGRKINNPDQHSVMYMAIHGIPHTKLDAVQAYLRPYAEKRNVRNRFMVEKLNAILNETGITLNFDAHVLPLSQWKYGGCVTERHLSYALALFLIERFGKGRELIHFLKNGLLMPLNLRIEELLRDQNNPVYEFDLLGAVKSDLVERFYVDASEECPPVRKMVSYVLGMGAIPAYPYLGNVADSVTGDKKNQEFEDDYLEELFSWIACTGFQAVAYMPSRNTREQLLRVKALCQRYGMMEISGEDINSPRQKFVCDMMRDPLFSNLAESAWALIGHERKVTKDPREGLFSGKNIAKYPSLEERIRVFAEESRMKKE